MKHLKTFESFLNEANSIIGQKSQKFIQSLQKFQGSSHQSPWMWLHDFCKDYPNLMQSTYFNKPIDPSYFNDVTKELGCKFEDVAISSERMINWGAIKRGTKVEDLEKLAKESGILYTIGGYNTNDSILWDATK